MKRALGRVVLVATALCASMFAQAADWTDANMAPNMRPIAMIIRICFFMVLPLSYLFCSYLTLAIFTFVNIPTYFLPDFTLAGRICT